MKKKNSKVKNKSKNSTRMDARRPQLWEVQRRKRKRTLALNFLMKLKRILIIRFSTMDTPSVSQFSRQNQRRKKFKRCIMKMDAKCQNKKSKEG